jgi:hypothetical protein
MQVKKRCHLQECEPAEQFVAQKKLSIVGACRFSAFLKKVMGLGLPLLLA